MKALQAPLFILFSFCIQPILNAQDCDCPANQVIKAEPGKEGAVVSFPQKASPCDPFTYTPASGTFFRLGSHSIIGTTAGGKKCSFTLTVTDNESPTLTPITLSRETLWPASGKLKKVKVNYTATDNAQDVKTAISVSSNTSDGVKDWEIVDDHLVRLKASRLNDGSPRIYTITVTATDEAGNKTTRTTTLAVSQTMKAKPIPVK